MSTQEPRGSPGFGGHPWGVGSTRCTRLGSARTGVLVCLSWEDAWACPCSPGQPSAKEGKAVQGRLSCWHGISPCRGLTSQTCRIWPFLCPQLWAEPSHPAGTRSGASSGGVLSRGCRLRGLILQGWGAAGMVGEPREALPVFLPALPCPALLPGSQQHDASPAGSARG